MNLLFPEDQEFTRKSFQQHTSAQFVEHRLRATGTYT